VNEGDMDLEYFAVTDFGLTKYFASKDDASHRHKKY